MKYITHSIRFSFGPNLYTPNRVIIAEYNHKDIIWPTHNKEALLKKLQKILTPYAPNLSADCKKVNFETAESFLLSFSGILLNFNSDLNIASKIVHKQNKSFMYMENFRNNITVLMAYRVTFQLLNCILEDGNSLWLKLNQAIIENLKQILIQSPLRLISSMLTAADNVGIPYYTLEHSIFVYAYGQGKNAVLFDHACSEKNSHIGAKYQNNKYWTTKILNMLGFPATQQFTVGTEEQCVKAAETIGYPVVVKPPEESKGTGISTNILNEKKLRHAFQLAKKHAKGVVIVENQVDGDDHRINIVNDEVFFVTKRMIPFIIGDGKKTIKELIEDENKRRLALAKDNLYYREIKFDAELKDFLNISGLSTENVLKNGTKLPLREVANMSHGGTKEFINPEDMHPDNHQMVKDLAKYFRLDSVGIDFITPDITKSWREAGSIVEINTSPMINEFMAEKFLETSLKDKNRGRIDTCLVLSNKIDDAHKIFNDVKNKYDCPAFVNNDTTIINDNEKQFSKEKLQQRCLTALLHPDCDYLMIHMSPDELLAKGLPIDKFSKCIYDQSAGDIEYEFSILDETHYKKTTLKNWLAGFCEECEQL